MKTRGTLVEAIGPRDGDFIELKNAWARVTIARNKQHDWRPGSWVVSGDIKDRSEVDFVTLRAALDYAWECLAGYQAGRGD